jgi:hypothetical protein
VPVEIELRKMRFIVAIAEERNFTRAAVRCHITQPALSRQVAEVEQLLGAKLFERRSRHVEITRPGGIFAREARRALEFGTTKGCSVAACSPFALPTRRNQKLQNVMLQFGRTYGLNACVSSLHDRLSVEFPD